MADPKNPEGKPDKDTSEKEVETNENGTADPSELSDSTAEDPPPAKKDGIDTTPGNDDATDDGTDAPAEDAPKAADTAPDETTAADTPASPWDKRADDADDTGDIPSGEKGPLAQDAVAEDILGDDSQDSSQDSDTRAGDDDPRDGSEDSAELRDLEEGADRIAATDDVLLTEPGTDTASEPKPEPAPSPEPAPQVIRETVVQRRAGFFPTLIGGILAAGAGFLGAQYQSGDWPFGTSGTDPFQAQTRSTLETQQDTLDQLTERVGAVESNVPEIDTAAFETAVADLGNQVEAVSSRLTDLSDQIGLLQVRLVELEKAPVAESVSPDAIAAYERELDALREDITQQRTEIENMASEAMAAEENAAAQAELAKVRAALADLTAALESGQPFPGAVSTISAADTVPVPGVLSTAATDGVPTRGALVDAFPEAARAALAAAREAGGQAEDTGNRFTVFLRDQLGARSVIPREGDDPDAVLSRAEAALRSGDLDTVLSELDTLPPEAQTAMEGWIAQARLRAEAQDAAAALSQELNKQ